jgi:ureidoglycolate dehydrogenase (NAD+)
VKVKRYDFSEVKKFCECYFLHLGISEEETIELVDVLIEADLKSIGSHGILRIPHYSERLINKTIKLHPLMSFKKIGNAAAILNADDGLGHLAGIKAMEKAIDLAKENGISAVSVINSSHFGIAGYFSEIAANNNMLGIAMTHTDANTAPYGAIESYLGSNALAFSAPTNEEYHFTADFSFTKISYGKIYSAILNNTLLPRDSAIDDKGNYTRNPHEVEHLIPAAEYKGYGMLLIIEILCSLLTGIPFCRYVNDMYKNLDEPRKLGHFFIAIDISKFNDYENFKMNISTLIKDLHSLKTDSNNGQVFIHGEKEYYSKKYNSENGISVQDELVLTLNNMAKNYKLKFPLPIK